MLIGIAGKKNVGKDTFARMLTTMLRGQDWPVFEAAFGNEVKRIAIALSGLPRRYFYDQSLKEVAVTGFKHTPREMMTGISDALRPLFGNDLFIRPVARQWGEEFRGEPKMALLVTDVRYENEASWIRKQGGVIIHIHRDTGFESDHESEQGIAPLPGEVVIVNDGTLEDLKNKCNQLQNYLTNSGNPV